MNEEQTQRWMKALASEPEPRARPGAERIWMLAQLEAEFESRRALAAPLVWIDTALRSAAGVTAIAVVCWLVGT